MKLLVLVTDAFGGHGGIAKFNRDLLAALSCHPSCEEVVALPRVVTQRVRALPARVDFRIGAARGRVGYVATLGRALASKRFDGVICGHLNLLPVAATAARISGAPLLLVTHGVEAWQGPARRGVSGALKRVDALVSVSHTTRERFLRWSQIDPRHHFIVPNCIDPSGFGAAPRDPLLMRRYGLEGRTVITTLGRLSSGERYKGIDEMLQLLPELTRDLPDVSYLIIGDGDDRPRLESLARRLGISARVIFTGYVSEEEKAAHYRLADVFVMIGRGEGFGIVYLEALACGVPVVASSADASREAVMNGELGEVASPDDPIEMRHAILRALSRDRAVPDALSHFSVDAFRHGWHVVVDSCFGKSGATTEWKHGVHRSGESLTAALHGVSRESAVSKQLKS